jgi:tRNA A37 threonylcarbamoyladenosine modification protein TsaB
MELSIDTASDWASIAVSDEGCLLGEMTWRCGRQHSVQLLPAVEGLLARLGADKGDLRALFVRLAGRLRVWCHEHGEGLRSP